MNSESDRNSSIKSRRDVWLAVVTVVISTVISLLIAEYGLRWYQQSISNSSSGDPGLLRYHALQGWTLTPSWQGGHRHHDFDVHYNINKYGFRGEPPEDLSQ
jgi:hypothetical protein